MELLPKKITIISIHIIGMYTDCLHIYYIWQMILPLLPDVLSQPKYIVSICSTLQMVIH